jgi:hypothetical protein
LSFALAGVRSRFNAPRPASGEATDTTSAFALAATVLASVAVLALAAAMQMRFGAFGDVSWLLTVCEGWLGGKTPYVDFIETNPPPAILLYMPATIAARFIGIRPETTIVVFGLGVACGSAWLTSAILKRALLLPRQAPLFGVLTLAALVILPGRTFDERDFYALLFGLPFVALAAARAEAAPISRAQALVAGVGLGLMVALKPPYAIVAALLVLHVALRQGARASLRAPELLAAASVVLSLAGASWLFFPAYFSDIAPMVAAAYLPVRESFATLTANAGLVGALTLGGVAIAASPRMRPDAATASFLIASVGAMIAYYVQGKGWLYHVYPALALACIAFASALERRKRDWRALSVASALALGTLAAAAAFDLSPLPTALISAVAARMLLMRLSPGDAHERLTILAGGALTGAACGLYALSFPGPAPGFVGAMLSHAAHPRIAAIGEGLGIGFPLTRDVGGQWTMRLQGMLMTAGARRLIDENPGDEALKARLAPIIARERDFVAEDIVRERPDVLLISRHGPRFHAWAMTDPKLTEARAPYRFVMSNPNPDWPVDLYIREDRLPLRGGS